MAMVENSAGWLIPRKAGDVTITASSVDGKPYVDRCCHVDAVDCWGLVVWSQTLLPSFPSLGAKGFI